MSVWSEDNQGDYPSQQDLQQWANSNGMTTIPVLGLTASDFDSWSDIPFVFEADLYIPTIYHIGPDMTVRAADNMDSNPSRWL